MADDKEREIQLQFLDEAEDHLQTLESVFMGLSSSRVDSTALNGALRAAHSMKGGGSLMGFPVLSELSHRLEDGMKVLKIQKDSVNIDDRLEYLLLSAVDCLRSVIDGNRKQMSPSADWITYTANPIFDELYDLLGDPTEEDAESVLSPEDGADILPVLFETEVEGCLQRIENLLATPDKLCLYEELLILAQELGGLGAMLQLDAFCHLCASIAYALQADPTRTLDIAQVAVLEWRRSQSLVLTQQIDLLPNTIEIPGLDIRLAPNLDPAEFLAMTPVSHEERDEDGWMEDESFSTHADVIQDVNSFSNSEFGDSEFGDSEFGDSEFGDSEFGDSEFGDGEFGDSEFGDDVSSIADWIEDELTDSALEDNANSQGLPDDVFSTAHGISFHIRTREGGEQTPDAGPEASEDIFEALSEDASEQADLYLQGDFAPQAPLNQNDLLSELFPAQESPLEGYSEESEVLDASDADLADADLANIELANGDLVDGDLANDAELANADLDENDAPNSLDVVFIEDWSGIKNSSEVPSSDMLNEQEHEVSPAQGKDWNQEGDRHENPLSVLDDSDNVFTELDALLAEDSGALDPLFMDTPTDVIDTATDEPTDVAIGVPTDVAIDAEIDTPTEPSVLVDSLGMGEAGISPLSEVDDGGKEEVGEEESAPLSPLNDVDIWDVDDSQQPFHETCVEILREEDSTPPKEDDDIHFLESPDHTMPLEYLARHEKTEEEWTLDGLLDDLSVPDHPEHSDQDNSLDVTNEELNVLDDWLTDVGEWNEELTQNHIFALDDSVMDRTILGDAGSGTIDSDINNDIANSGEDIAEEIEEERSHLSDISHAASPTFDSSLETIVDPEQDVYADISQPVLVDEPMVEGVASIAFSDNESEDALSIRDLEPAFPSPASEQAYTQVQSPEEDPIADFILEKDSPSIHEDAIQKDAIQTDITHEDNIQTDIIHEDTFHEGDIQTDSIQMDAFHEDDIQTDIIHENDIQTDSIRKDITHEDNIQTDIIHEDDIQIDSIQMSVIHEDDIQIDSIQRDAFHEEDIQTDSTQTDTILEEDIQTGSIQTKTLSFEAKSQISAESGANVTAIEKAPDSHETKATEFQLLNPTSSGVLPATENENTFVRVGSKHLNQLNDLFGELTIDRNGLTLHLKRLRSLVKTLNRRVKLLDQANTQLRSFYDQGATVTADGPVQEGDPYKRVQSLMNSIEAESRDSDLDSVTLGLENQFDALEMDNYSDLHHLFQAVMEGMVQIQEVAEDLDLNLDDSEQSARNLNKTSRQLQIELMHVRMRPLSDIASRFPRALRELSLKHKKPVEFKLQGGNTLIDRTILDSLGEPLMHLVRNAFDHGIEDKATRQSCGKPEVATVEIRASHQGNRTIISISDDGQGIALDKIRDRARQMGLDEMLLAAASEQELLSLIFEPGFSTAAKTTDLSGRGVGMDVVRDRLQHIHGDIKISTRAGQGTTFTLSVPLTLSVTRVLLAESNGMLIAIPTDTVDEMIMLEPEQIMTTVGREVFEYDGKMAELIRLDQWLHFYCPRAMPEPLETPASIKVPSVLIVKRGNQVTGIEVERSWSEQEVTVRRVAGAPPMPDGFSSCTILGDGRVVPLINIPALMHWIMSNQRTTPPVPSLASLPAPESSTESTVFSSTIHPTPEPTAPSKPALPETPALPSASSESPALPSSLKPTPKSSSASESISAFESSVSLAPPPPPFNPPRSSHPPSPMTPDPSTYYLLNQKPQILIVDDSIAVRRLLALTLEKAAYRVEQAKDGQDALEKLNTGLHIDAMICDIEMPRLDGYRLLAKMKASARLKHVPVMMLTSRSGEKHRKLAMSLGAIAYFTKPYNEQLLVQRLADIAQVPV